MSYVYQLTAMGSLMSLFKRLTIQNGCGCNQSDNREEATPATSKCEIYRRALEEYLTLFPLSRSLPTNCIKIANELYSESAIKETDVVEIKTRSKGREQVKELLNILFVREMTFIRILHKYDVPETAAIEDSINHKCTRGLLTTLTKFCK
ncbi:uncharacterized protein TRIADDRAFT_62638 [Trichoplax adhaerens]|uniref:Uncharacterized protein n=1 Tax=Trichoplax adhaerens TaxID=10228 RepID=B3SEE7_TRIAD|nr:predicted protein [Trichoplax adhaerens]EDV18898.1 predicted protein [Trichoplax adhaerens]|eukprot:XP_002118616.1 predicted protein [Trichoplax adhaerens]